MDTQKESATLFDALRSAPEDSFVITPEVARWRSREERKPFGVYRTEQGRLLWINPAPKEESACGLRRVERWLEPSGRWVLALGAEPRESDPRALLDRYGLLLRRGAEASVHARPSETLLDRPGLFHVRAPARTGKSYVAEHLIETWRATRNERAELLRLEEGQRGSSPWTPPWWEGWCKGEGRALWVIDSVDEAHWQRISLEGVLHAWRRLDAPERDRLTVILLQREDATLEATRPPEGVTEWFRLLPIDEEEALRILRDASSDEEPSRATEALERAKRAIDLLEGRSLGSLPDLIPVLAEAPPEATRSDLARLLTEALVARSRPDREKAKLPTSQLLRSAEQLAAVMLLTGRARVSDTSGEQILLWSEVFPHGASLTEARKLERTALLIAEPGALRFRERHLLEELAASALLDAEVWPSALRELMTDEGEGRLRPDLHGLSTLLEERSPKLREHLTRWRATEGRNEKPDFVVVASLSPTETIPIEVKWSHHKECVESLSAQLGQRYLLDERRYYGIYVVGFSGEGRHRDLGSLREALFEERKKFQAANSRVSIEVVILPFV